MFTVSESRKYRLCWRKLDSRNKKVTFSIKILSHDSQEAASLDTVNHITKEFGKMQDRLDLISRNVYLQQEADKQHSDSKKSGKLTRYSHGLGPKHADVDERA